MQKVPGHRADNRKRQTTELAVTMSWKDELVVTDTAKTLTAGNIGSEWAAVHQVLGRPALKTPVDGLTWPSFPSQLRQCVCAHMLLT